jgi:hypothetical protein
MRRVTWKSFTLLALFTLAGCAAKNVDQSINPSQLTDTGLVFASLSTSNEYRYGPIATFRLDRGGIIKSREEHIPGATLKPSELQDDYGRLVVLELPAGDNSLRYWLVTHGVTQYHPVEEVPAIGFTVEPGKAVYLGNLHINVRMGKNFVNQPVIGDLLPEIRDRSQRDLEMFRARYPNVAEADIIPKQPFIGVWSRSNPFLAH